MAAKHGLGRGLGALIKDTSAPEKKTRNSPKNDSADHSKLELLDIAVDLIQANPYQPRDEFSQKQLDELTVSVQAHGVLQPLLVRLVADTYELVAGERRLRAARQAGLRTVPVRLIKADEQISLELALVENLQRTDLNPVEEARGYQALILQFGLSQEAVAEKVGKARATVTNSLRILDLPGEVQKMLVDGSLSVGHAKVLLGLHLDEDRVRYARRAVEEGWSVRVLERITASLKDKPRQARRLATPDVPPEHLRHLTDLLHQHFGTAVRVTPSRTLTGGRKVKGTLEVDFYSNEDFNRLLDIIGIEA